MKRKMDEDIDLEELRQEAIDVCPEDEKMGVMILILAELRKRK